MTNSYFVLEKEKPKMQKLKNLLEMNLYMGQIYDRNNDAKKVYLLISILVANSLFDFNLILIGYFL